MSIVTEITVDRNRYHERERMIKWCEQCWGPAAADFSDEFVWSVTSAFGVTQFYFVKPADATAFSMRWL